MAPITVHRVVATLTIPRHVPDLIKLVDNVLAAMTNNPAFKTPVPSLATVAAQAQTLNTAQTQAKTRVVGAIAVRENARAAVVTSLHQLKGYVQQVADASPEQAEAIIRSAGMTVRKPSSRNKAPFVAKQGPVSGSVVLIARAVSHRASYDWEWSSDAGKTWTQVASTLKARTTITGLPVATTCAFRFRTVTKAGESDWSGQVTLVVK